MRLRIRARAINVSITTPVTLAAIRKAYAVYMVRLIATNARGIPIQKPQNVRVSKARRGYKPRRAFLVLLPIKHNPEQTINKNVFWCVRILNS